MPKASDQTNEQVMDLLLAWADGRAAGCAPPIDELCRECPELVDRVRFHVERLEAMRWLEVRDLLDDASHDSQRSSPTASRAERDTSERGALRGVSERQVPQRLRDYELLERIGAGGMGVVYRARHIHLDRPVAVKLLPAGDGDDHRFQRFQREMKAGGRLEHPHIVRVTDAGVEEGTPFLVMELIDGCDLASFLQTRGQLTVGAACEIARQAALGLAYAHEQGIVHRDVKPSNLMLTRNGIVKVMDLGLARWSRGQEGAITQTSQAMGTVDYMAPEQGRDAAEAGTPADVYGLGCTLFHLLAGIAPFVGSNYDSVVNKLLAHQQVPPPLLRSLCADAPEGLEQLVNQMLAKVPPDRPATMHEVARRLAEWATPYAADSAELQTEAPIAPDTSSKLVAATLPVPALGANRWRASVAKGPTGWIGATLGLFLAIAAVAIGWQYRQSKISEGVAGSPAQAAMAVEPSPVEPAGRSASDLPLAITQFKLDHFRYRDNQGQALGQIGRDTDQAQVGDDVRLSVEFSDSCYGYVLALNPNGKVQLCLPEDDSQPPPVSNRLEMYPSATDYFSLTDGVGVQAFAIVASREPLPSYHDWRTQLPTVPWQAQTAPGMWRYRGGRFEPVFLTTNREQKGRLPSAFQLACVSLQRVPGITLLEAFAFPVVESAATIPAQE